MTLNKSLLNSHFPNFVWVKNSCHFANFEPGIIHFSDFEQVIIKWSF